MVKNRPIKDSGKRRGFSTGSVRDTDEDKGRPSLLSPIVELELSKHFQKGGSKYGWRNWEKGQPLSALLDSARRHELEMRIGYDDENHLIAWLWNVYCFVHTKYCIDRGILPKELDDLPSYMPKKLKPTPPWSKADDKVFERYQAYQIVKHAKKYEKILKKVAKKTKKKRKRT